MLNDRIACALVLVFCASACRQIAGIDDPQPWDGGGAGDSGSNDGSIGESCYGTGLVEVCLDAPASGATMLPDGMLDTDSSPLCATNVTSVTSACVVAGNTVVLPSGATLVATGAKPLIVVAHDSITISGTLSVASHLVGGPGAGSSTGTCNAAASPSGGGGGAGGSFGGLGGDGGAPNTTTAGAIPPAPTSLRGGCPGKRGSSGGAEGAGGGATFLIAKAQIDLTGSINASGAGAEHADSGVRGGSGGGSGGMIGLDAPTLQISGSVFANGGGGSGGSDGSSEGDDGGDPSAAGSGGAGGGGSGTAGQGGDGAAGTTLTGAPGGAGTSGTSGGGGGGGGAGVVKLYGTRTGAGTISPPPT